MEKRPISQVYRKGRNVTSQTLVVSLTIRLIWFKLSSPLTFGACIKVIPKLLDKYYAKITFGKTILPNQKDKRITGFTVTLRLQHAERVPVPLRCQIKGLPF